MFESWKISWRYFKDAWSYIKTHPKIFKIPLFAIGLWLLIMLPILLSIGIEVLWWLKNPSERYIMLGLLLFDFFLIYLLTNLVGYVYQGMIVAAVYASEIGREEGLLDNLKGNWGALFKFALLTTLFSLGISAFNLALGKASSLVRLVGKFASVFIAKTYQLLTAFTACAIVIEELPMSKALKRSVSLVRKNLVPTIFGIIISDLMGTLGLLVIFLSLFVFLGLGLLLMQVFGIIAFSIALLAFFIFFVVGVFAIAIIASLVTNVYYSLVYLNALKEEGSPLIKYYGMTGTPLTLDEGELETVLKARYGSFSLASLKESLQGAIDWWERRASKWARD